MKRTFIGALAALAFGFLFSSSPAYATTNSEPSPWNNTNLKKELGFTCSSNPTIENLGTSFNITGIPMKIKPQEVTVAVIPAMGPDCNYLLPIGNYTLESMEVKLFTHFSALDSEAIVSRTLNPDSTLKTTFTGLEPGKVYYARVKSKFRNTDTNQFYRNVQTDTVTVPAAFNNAPKYFKFKKKKDGTIIVKMKKNHPAYKNRENAKVRLLLMNSKKKKRNVKAPVVKYFNSAKSVNFRYYRFADTFAATKRKQKKNYLAAKASHKLFIPRLIDGKIEETTDVESFTPKKWVVGKFIVNRKGELKKIKKLKKYKANKKCNITRCKVSKK